MIRYRHSGLSIANDFKLLKDITSQKFWARRWQRKPVTDSVKKVKYIIGIDEVSNGALAGPFIVTGCCFTKPFEPTGPLVAVNDCKKVSPKALPHVSAALESCPSIVYEHIVMHAAEIDRVRNIKASKFNGWVRCIANLTYKVYAEQLSRLTKDDMGDLHKIAEKGVIIDFPSFCEQCAVIIDGEEEPRSLSRAKHPTFMYSTPRADHKFFCVAAASVLAKQKVNALMEGQYHKRFVEYNFKKNKGYATREHCDILRQIGPCEIHRRTFIQRIWNDVMLKPAVTSS